MAGGEPERAGTIHAEFRHILNGIRIRFPGDQREGDDPETKLEKIITQKYIANFPYSFEGWSDMRRTGYPKIFPVLNVEDGDGSLQQGDLIRRMPFPGTENEAVQQDIITSGLDALGSEDKQDVRLWWDTETSNF